MKTVFKCRVSSCLASKPLTPDKPWFFLTNLCQGLPVKSDFFKWGTTWPKGNPSTSMFFLNETIPKPCQAIFIHIRFSQERASRSPMSGTPQKPRFPQLEPALNPPTMLRGTGMTTLMQKATKTPSAVNLRAPSPTLQGGAPVRWLSWFITTTTRVYLPWRLRVWQSANTIWSFQSLFICIIK